MTFFTNKSLWFKSANSAKNIIYLYCVICVTIIIIRTCKQTKLNAPSVTVVITFKAIRNELCTECSFSAIELNVWRSVMREQASAAEPRASAVNLSSVPSPQRNSYYALDI